MLKKLQFKNYRCFKNSTIYFKETSIIAGKNNSGKSTIIEALRLISLAGNKSLTAIYKDPPISLEISLSKKGFSLPVDKLKIDLRAIQYFYNDNANAELIATFYNGCIIEIYINSEVAFACLKNANGKKITNKSSAANCEFDNLQILPQIGLIKENEKLLARKTIVGDRDSYLSSRHFRNELLLYKNEYFDDFKTLAENTWQGLRIRELDYTSGESDFISLLIDDEAFPAEIGFMGSGIQMWLQIIWFICRVKNCDTIILDEPDVYMHPDLQRKLIKFLLPKFNQIIIATHSVEILSEVEPSSIVTIDKNSRNITYANSEEGVQNIIDTIGSVHNLALVRISNFKKCVFVEGNDIKILDKLHTKLFPTSDISLATFPCVPLGGWKNFNQAIGVSKLFHKETKDSIECFCFLDRDYYTDDTIKEKHKLAENNYLNLHVWKKKEIENYLIVPNALFRISKLPEIQYKSFLLSLNELVNKQKVDLIDQFSQKIQEYDRSKSIQTCNQTARKYVDSHWTSLEEKISLLPGKTFIKTLNSWMLEKYNQKSSINHLIYNIHSEEIDDEIKKVIGLLI